MFKEIFRRLEPEPRGVYRRHWLAGDGRAAEAILTCEDLRKAKAVHVCNALRDLRRAELVRD